MSIAVKCKRLIPGCHKKEKPQSPQLIRMDITWEMGAAAFE